MYSSRPFAKLGDEGASTGPFGRDSPLEKRREESATGERAGKRILTTKLRTLSFKCLRRKKMD